MQKAAKPSFQSVSTLGKLSVGKPLPTYAGTSESGQKASNQPSEHKSLIHLLHIDLPSLIKAIYQNVDLPDVETILQDSEAIFAQTD